MAIPPKPLPPAPKPIAPAPSIAVASAKKFGASAPTKLGNARVVLYGTGGVGKTSLAMAAPGPVSFVDLDGSLGVLNCPADVTIVNGIETFQDLRDALRQDDLWADKKTIVIDTASRAEELAVTHVLANVRKEDGSSAARIEDFGYGKGYRHVYDTMLLLLQDLEDHWRKGRNVILICHDNASKVPNPAGEDFIRWEPRLQNQNNGNVRFKLKEWADHLLFIGYDVSAAKGKAKGSGTRTIYPIELAHFMAKSRSIGETIPYPVAGDPTLWDRMFDGLPF